MSRIGSKTIHIPAGVKVSLENRKVMVSGPKGELVLELHPLVELKLLDSEIALKVQDPGDQKQLALWGLYRNLVSNMILGVTEGFMKKLEINGIGFKALLSGKVLVLHVGFSHPVEYALPEGIQIIVQKNIIEISGIDKQKVGKVAADIRAVWPVEPYKGKGIKYIDEVVRRKAGKAAVKTES